MSSCASRPAACATALDSDSASDSDDHDDGFVKVNRWTPLQSPHQPSFAPTIPLFSARAAPPPPTTTSTSAASHAVSATPPAPVSSANNSSHNTNIIGRVRETIKAVVSTGSLSAAHSAPYPAEEDPQSSSDTDSMSSCSDEEISSVLDETEIQLIEAMEDIHITPRPTSVPVPPESAAKRLSSAKQSQMQSQPLSSSPHKPRSWIGLGESTAAPRPSINDSLKERFGSNHILKPSGSSIRVTAGTTINSSSDSDSESGLDDAAGTQHQLEKQQPADTGRATSVPLDSIEFVAPGVTKLTAMSLLRRVLDIDGPVIQMKMVEFLLIDGVIASLIGFITHCQGSIYSPSSSTAHTAPSSPLHQQNSTSSNSSMRSNSSSNSSDYKPGSQKSLNSNSGKDLPLDMLQEFELRSQHRTRLQRQRNRSAGLTETDLRRGYNAAQMLSGRDQYARRVVEAKLSVILPCLMAVFHKDSLGSFHHACLLLEHCFTLSPLRTTQLLLYQQNSPSRWWSLSESVANGKAPICDILPYLSEPCVQRLFSKAEFGVWTGRLMTSLNLMPNDAVVVSDELNRMGLGSVANALSNAKGADDSGAARDSHNPQRAKALQLVRNRFQQLNRGGFFDQILELIEDPDPNVSEGAAEFMAFMINDCSTFYGFNLLFKPILDSEVPVRRLAQLIVNSTSQRLSPQARAATRLLHALLSKTSCQFGLRTREAQGVREPEMHPRGSQVLLSVSQAVRNALESFLPGLLATVTGLQGNTDLTSQSAYNRRASVESLQLPEYDETDMDFDTDGTEAEDSDADESDAVCSSHDGEEGDDDDDYFYDDDDDDDDDGGDSCREYGASTRERSRTVETEGASLQDLQLYNETSATANANRIGYASSDDGSDANNEHDVNDLRNSAAALLQSTYPESIGSGSISSSLSPSSTLSASPMAIASSTPERAADIFSSENLDTEDLGLLVSLPKPDINRLNLLQVCVEVMRECRDLDGIMGWVDLRVWHALSTWFMNHPHNNILHMAVYQMTSMITLEAVRLRQAQRKLAIDPRYMDEVSHSGHGKPYSSIYSHSHAHAHAHTAGMSGDDYDDDVAYNSIRLPKKNGSTACGIILHSDNDVCSHQLRHHHFDEEFGQQESRARIAARRRAHRRREMAERIRHEESSNCDNILTYLIEQNQWIDKLVRRAVSPNYDGTHGYISLILNTLRLATQVDRRRHSSSFTRTKGLANEQQPTDVSKNTGSRRSSGIRSSGVANSAVTASLLVWQRQQQQMVDGDPLAAIDRSNDIGSKITEHRDNDLSSINVDESLLPDLAYHDPQTRQLLCEYPMYRLQRWEISLLYSASFRAHLQQLREQARDMARKLDEFRLCDQTCKVSLTGPNTKRPVPFFSPQRVKPPVSLDNKDIKKKQMEINVGLLLGNGGSKKSESSGAATGNSSSASSSGVGGASKSSAASAKPKSSGSTHSSAASSASNINEEGVDIDSLYARMLGFTEDLVDGLSQNSSLASSGKSSDFVNSPVKLESGFPTGSKFTGSSNTIDAGAGGTTTKRGSRNKQRGGNKKPTASGKAGNSGSGGSLRRKKSRLGVGTASSSSNHALQSSIADLFEEIASASDGGGITAESDGTWKT
ncbi:hypothetical protein GGI07_005583, partial [Coemansia sp. Benny D115]